MSKLFTTQEIAAIYGVDVSCVRQWCRREGLEPAVRGGRGRGKTALFDPDEVARWIVEDRLLWGDSIASIDIEDIALEWLKTHRGPAA